MNIAVYCSSSNEVRDSFKSLAAEFGNWIARNGHTLVYGGATGGLMSAVADAVAANGGDIVGVIPEAIISRGRKADLPMQCFTVDTMSERKDLMREYADVFVVFPGGYGTLDELFDVLSAGMVGEHEKMTILFNPEDFWAELLMFFSSIEKQGLAYKRNRRLHVANDLNTLYDEIASVADEE